ncbi:MAG: winged helix-turn-helix domain-containing protein [Proteobacteria bacterium]|nr:winged helix-turn-helix domain-containing protein [Pseudomonadota bacterium]
MTSNQRIAPNDLYRFGRFALQPATQRLLVDGESVSVGPRAFELLVALVERAGQVVSKLELLDLVWPGLVVEENNLQVQISTLRKILGPNAITTLAGRGYRFTLPIDSADQPQKPLASEETGLTTPEKTPSIAVLPFINLSDDVANEYFADGLSEELINVLSKIRGLRVVSRTSAFSFKGAKVDIQTVARKLNVTAVLEGSVRKAGLRVRINAQLVQVASDSSLWSKSYDRELEDIFAVQDDIARSVVQGLRTTLMGESSDEMGGGELAAELRAAAKGRSKSAEAYRIYLQGAFFMKRYNAEDMTKAIRHFRNALEIDPGFAVAWASLSFCYMHQSANAWAPIAEGAECAWDAARHALETGPEVAESHWARSTVLMYYDWDWQRAEASISQALHFAPDDSTLIVGAVTLMQNLGRLEEADALVQRALVLDPLNVEAHITSGLQLTITGRLMDAQNAYLAALELSPQHVRIHYWLGRLHLLEGRDEEALAEVAREEHETFRLLGFVLAHHARGQARKSKDALQQLILKYAEDAAYQIAQAYAYRGEADSAFEWLERAFGQRDAGVASMKIDVLLHRLHGDPRWHPMLERVRLEG